MADTAVTHGIPQHPTDLPRGHIPYDACESDFTVQGGKSRRLRIIRVVHPDQNQLVSLIEDLGPPTGERGVHIPCHMANDMGYVHELLDQAKRNRQSRAAADAIRLAERHLANQRGLLALAEEGIARQRGLSSFGPHINIERSSP